MSEFVLKLAGWDSEAPIVWLPGVTKVQRLGIATVKDSWDKWSSYEADMQFLSNNIGPEYIVTLLWVETASYRGPAIVEQAWLLGPSGGTVERISGV